VAAEEAVTVKTVEPLVPWSGAAAVVAEVAVTVRTVVPVTPLSVALILDVPVATAVASPPLLMVATVVVADVHVT
jgi:hypothetical protein